MHIIDNQRITVNSRITGNQRITVNLRITGNLCITVNLRIPENPRITVNPRITGNPCPTGNPRITENLYILGNPCSTENLCILENPCITKNLCIIENPRIAENLRITGNPRVLCHQGAAIHSRRPEYLSGMPDLSVVVHNGCCIHIRRLVDTRCVRHPAPAVGVPMSRHRPVPEVVLVLRVRHDQAGQQHRRYCGRLPQTQTNSQLHPDRRKQTGSGRDCQGRPAGRPRRVPS